MPDLSIIIPTYKEAESIGTTIKNIHDNLSGSGISYEVVVVDDNSPDDTVSISSGFGAKVILRTTDKGLAKSVAHGFHSVDSKVIVVMDGDGQHPAEIVPLLYHEIINGVDIAIATRTDIPQWSLPRRIISAGATLLARVIFPSVSDPGSGFFAINRSVIDNIDLKPRGWKILIEVLGRGRYKTITEIPYTFKNRNNGSSKLRFSHMWEYWWHLVELSFYGIFHNRSPIHTEVTRAAKFAIVGISGIAVNLLVLYSIIQFTFIPQMLAAPVSIEISILTNFIFNDIWTFKDLHERKFIKRLGRFQFVSIGGLIINAVIFATLVSLGLWYITAELIGILVAFAWNFIANRMKTWG